jgi:heptaprenylglyceryl phosphate synthase
LESFFTTTSKRTSTGDEFALRENGLFCKIDNDALHQITKIDPDTAFIKIENDVIQNASRENTNSNEIGSTSGIIE